MDVPWDGSKLLSLDHLQCPVTNCYLTNNRDLKPVEEYDALVFHETNIVYNPTDLPRRRNLDQYYVHHTVEPPFGSVLLEVDEEEQRVLGSYFNISINYRHDAVVRNRVFGDIVKTGDHPPDSRMLENIIVKFGRDNKHLAFKPHYSGTSTAQFVSNCQTLNQR